MYNLEYEKEISDFTANSNLDFLNNTTILITGGTGLILSYFVDSVLQSNLSINLVLLCRNKNSAVERFNKYNKDKRLTILQADLTKKIEVPYQVDYILSGASFADPKSYATKPVETINTNVLGNYNLFEFAKTQKKLKKFVVFSSCEIYGENKETLYEDTFGLVKTTDVRSCYNESKRLIETMAVAYSSEYNINTVIARLSRVYGPTVKLADSKAIFQFIFNALNKKDIVLKSTGEQQFSYCYVSDAINAILTLMQNGENAQAYNITNDTEVIKLKDIAKIIADICGVKIIFDLPTQQEANAYSRAVIALQNCDKLKAIGWKPQVDFVCGIKKTLNILKNRIK